MSITIGSRGDSQSLAQAVHDLGSALWFGGTVMGVAGVNKSGADLTQGIDRVRVARSAWARFAPVQWAAIAATVGAGSRLTQGGTGRLALQQGFGRAGTAKAAVVALGAGATAFAAYSGSRIGKLAEEATARGEKVEVRDATIPAGSTPPEIATWQRRQRVAQFAVPVLSGANIALGAYLTQSYRTGTTVMGVAKRLRRNR
jgi:hypothetical protein